MSQVIRIPVSVFRRLQNLAVPFVDTPADVIARLLDEHEKSLNNGKSVPRLYADSGLIKLNPLNPESLSHSRVLQAKVAGKTVRPKWNSVLVAAHQYALEKLSSFEKLREITLANIADGNRDDSGFRFIDGAGFSIQYCDSNHAWTNALHLAQKLGFEVEVLFEWMNKSKALHPGEKGILHWKP